MTTKIPHRPKTQSNIRKNFIARNESFLCQHCGIIVLQAIGTYRNHCTFCLYSKHVDGAVPGNRDSLCNGMMIPISVEKQGKQFRLTHQCMICKKITKNKTADDDSFDKILDIVKKNSFQQSP